jgi:hypothetical protein
MKSIIYPLVITLAVLIAPWHTMAQEIVGYSDIFTFDTRLTSVQGTISDSGNGNGIAGALITLTGPGNTHSATSGAGGI